MIIKLHTKFYISALSSKRLQSCTPKCPCTEAKHKQKIDGTEQVHCQNLPVATSKGQIPLVLSLKIYSKARFPPNFTLGLLLNLKSSINVAPSNNLFLIFIHFLAETQPK